MYMILYYAACLCRHFNLKSIFELRFILRNMNHAAIIKLCKELGCCNACCLRYLGFKNPKAYENSREFIVKYQEKYDTENESKNEVNWTTLNNQNYETTDCGPPEIQNENGLNKTPVDGHGDYTSAKRLKIEGVCVSCMGVLQGENWPECIQLVKDMLEKKRYECDTFACALSSPIAALLRERVIALHLNNMFKEYDAKTLTPLKEAWKWSFGTQLAPHIHKTLDSGAVAPLLITLNLEYPDESEELNILKQLSPSIFESRNKQKKRFSVEFTRPCVESALRDVSLRALQGVEGWRNGLPTVVTKVKCVSVVCTHAPVYLGGRYIKLSRELPQTPWVVNGKRMMESSVQEIIFEPIARIYELAPEEVESRLKFMSAGREDVDVRCLGDGRPFAIEITDPRRQLTESELKQACEDISKSGKAIVKCILPITRDDLIQLKKGEETKCKTYEALCIKLSHTKEDIANGKSDCAITVTPQDIANINTYRNTGPDDAAPVQLCQRTPVRVLHRRPLRTRIRRILDLNAAAVPGHPQLFCVRVRTEAGTYIKEWAHGELRRTRPALAHALRARADILALDVACVDLPWPPPPPAQDSLQTNQL